MLLPRRQPSLLANGEGPWAVLPTGVRRTCGWSECMYRDYWRLSGATADGAERLYVDPKTVPTKLERREPHYLWATSTPSISGRSGLR